MTARIPSLLGTLAALLITGCGGGDPAGDGDAGGADAADADADARPRISIELGRPFPDLAPAAATEASPALPPETPGWTVVGLYPATCAGCETDLPELAVATELWADRGLGFVGIFEATPAEVGVMAARTRTEHLALAATELPLFPITRILDASTYALLDSTGTVRFVARQAGILPERFQSLSRQHRLLRAGPEHQAEVVREAYPHAAGIEIRSTLDTEWLGPRTLELGLSPWFAVVTDSAGDATQVVFPMERDTNCTTCEPMFLLVGIEEGGAIDRVHAIEPVISLGEVQDTVPLFNRVKGAHTRERLAALPALLNSTKADIVARQLLSVALDLGRRVPPGFLDE